MCFVIMLQYKMASLSKIGANVVSKEHVASVSSVFSLIWNLRIFHVTVDVYSILWYEAPTHHSLVPTILLQV